MDRIDIKILKILQKNAETTVQEISKLVHLSTTPCWQRINRLKKSGIIQKTVSLIDPEKANLKTTVFVQIKMESHDHEKLKLFANVVKGLPEIVGCYRMSGEVDYLLKVITPDIAGYDDFYKKLIQDIDFINVTSNFSIETLKNTTVLPIKL